MLVEILERGKVVKLKKNLVYVEIVKKDKCEGCKVCAFGKDDKIILPSLTDAACAAGDEVEIMMPKEKVALSPLYLYVLPLLLMLAGLLVSRIFGGALLQFCVSIVMLGLGILAAYGIDKIYRKKRKYMPVVVSIIEKGEKSK